MAFSPTLLLDIWREVGRHLELHESVPAIGRMLSRHLSHSALLIRGFDEREHAIETLAACGSPAVAPATSRQSLTPARLKRLQAWALTGELLHAPPGKRMAELAALVPEEFVDEVLAAPLRGPAGGSGALLLFADHARPFTPAHHQLAAALAEPLSAAVENHRRLHELAALREAAEADRRSLLSRLGKQEMSETIVGADSGLKLVMERAALVAKSDVPVLILGETGTGKEVVSRAIHTRSRRAGQPFIRVNCGSIPADLIDSQLFGHEKGSFTGATDTRPGWFERADGGTLFLDEIGELPLAAQVRFLRVLQDGYIERVGGHAPIHVDVRIVAATHRDLAGMVKNRSFREDLWYRVNVFRILLPRLRERTEDIPALACHFAQRAANRFGLRYVEPSASDLDLLTRYSWPGNIRELAAVIDRAAILGSGERLEVALALGSGQTAANFSQAILSGPTLYEVIPDPPPPADIQNSSPQISTLNAAMKQHIERALAAAGGRVEGRRGAAELLGINPHTLRARMRKLHIDWSKFRPPA